MNPWIKSLYGILFSVIVLLIILIVGSIYMLNKSLPDYSGDIVLENLNNEVEIYRDSNGVAFINSKTETDAYFALGYVHAQERLFQMDINRRAGEGRLSEILGSKTLFFDKMFKTIGLKRLAEENFKKYDEHTKSILIAYANGINEFIRKSHNKLTIEFDILNYKPYEWKPEHSILLTKLMAWELNISWWSDLALAHLIQKLGPEKVRDILPDFDENAPAIIPDKLNNYSTIPIDLIETDREFRKLIGAVGTHIGSNNWVVNGERSQSGKPIIANDPHLGFTSPGKWFVASIKSPNIQIDGFTIPGIPGVVIGKNESISWVLTNVMADDSDFYIENIDTSRSNYFFNNEWQPLEIITDTILVKDSANVIFEIRKTHRGPIISDIHTFNKLFPNTEQQKVDLSMRWTALDYSNELAAFYKINHAVNWNEFNVALELFHSPGQNFVYADTAGNIGYSAGVKLPIRKTNSSSFVSDGTNDENDWIGYVPINDNPRLFNPQNGYIASANNKTIENYPYHISNLWEPKSRINRITELLERKEKHGVEDFKNYQMDFYSHFAKDLIPFIPQAFEGYQINDENIRTSLNILKQWNFNLEANSQIPSIYAAFFQFLLKNLFEDEMGENLLKEYIFLANIPYRVVPKLLRENKSDWFDNISTETIESRDDIIRISFISAIEYLESEFGNDIKNWQWGNIHKVSFNHFFHGNSSILDKILDVGPFSIGGDGTTIFNTEYYLTAPYENKLGPSMRYIFDFSNPDKFEFILPTGQSGHFFSDNYDNMTNFWLEGKYLTVNTNLDSVRVGKYSLLRLIPQR